MSALPRRRLCQCKHVCHACEYDIIFAKQVFHFVKASSKKHLNIIEIKISKISYTRSISTEISEPS